VATDNKDTPKKVEALTKDLHVLQQSHLVTKTREDQDY